MDLTVSMKTVEELISSISFTTEEKDNFSWSLAAIFLFERAFESSIAERLHDLARNSMDSVGVSGGGQLSCCQQVAGPSSSMLSSLSNVPFPLHEFTNTIASIQASSVSILFS